MKRLRHLTKEEANVLLKALKKESPEVWKQALISLHTGLRASEIFRLKYIDIDLNHGTIVAKDSKNKTTRYAYITQDVKDSNLGHSLRVRHISNFKLGMGDENETSLFLHLFLNGYFLIILYNCFLH